MLIFVAYLNYITDSYLMYAASGEYNQHLQ